MKTTRIHYDVTLSFAEEDRDFVHGVAEALETRGLRIFYDNFARVDLWGRSLSFHLDEVYRKKSRFCVIFTSEHYKRKYWTRFEWERAQARAFFMEQEQYILPFRMDEADLQGITDTLAYLALKDYDEQRLADAIFDKVERNKPLVTKLFKKSRFFLRRRKKLVAVVVAIAILAGLGLAGKFTPVDILARQRYEDSWYILEGAICKDDTISSSHGRGTCSGHGGVKRYFKKEVYRKTKEQCRKEAEQISWIDDLFGSKE